MTRLDYLYNWLGPGCFPGIRLSTWLRVLVENRFDIDPLYLGRAGAITVGSTLNSTLSFVEQLLYSRKVTQVEVEPPLFVLGIFRSGTTFLQHLLAQDKRFATPNLIEVNFPSSFLTAQAFYSALATVFLPKRRPQDQVDQGPWQPHEEEWAICNLTGRALVVDLAFPRRAESYRRYYNPETLSTAEREEWLAALSLFVQKLTFRHRRKLVLKSPANTCRIRMLTELFPNAKFIHVRRDPFAVFQSWHHMVCKLAPQMTMQRLDFNDLSESIIRVYRQVYMAYFQQKSLIPAGDLFETSFEELESDPLRVLQTAYKDLGLPSFETAQPAIQRYLKSHASYPKNRHAELSDETRDRIIDQWRFCFENWGYAIPNS